MIQILSQEINKNGEQKKKKYATNRYLEVLKAVELKYTTVITHISYRVNIVRRVVLSFKQEGTTIWHSGDSGHCCSSSLEGRGVWGEWIHVHVLLSPHHIREITM